MKLIPRDSGQVQIEFADSKESQCYQAEAVRVRELMPKLARLWVIKPRFLDTVNDCWELMLVGGRLGDFHIADESWLTGMQELVVREIREEAKGGRPLDGCTLVAAMRLMLFAPHDLVLKLEKKRREEQYLAEDKRRGLKAAAKETHARVIRDADMCVARSQRIVDKAREAYLREHPSDIVYFLMFSDEASKVDVQALLAAQTAEADTGAEEP